METSLCSVSLAAQKIQEGAEELRNAVIETGAEALETCCCDAEAYIKTKPYNAIFLALGAGALTGMLFFRREIPAE